MEPGEQVLFNRVLPWVRFGRGSDQVVPENTEIQELKRRLALAEAVFDAIEEGFCICELLPGEPCDLKYVSANAAFERQAGLIETVGRTLRELVPTVPDAVVACYARVATTRRAESFESHVPGLDRWFEAAVTAVGEPGQIAILFRDITTRKRAEAALRDSRSCPSTWCNYGCGPGPHRSGGLGCNL